MRIAYTTLFALLVSAVSYAQTEFSFTSDFSSSDRADYVLVDPIGQLTGSEFAEFHFNGDTARVVAPTSPDAMLGPARAGFEFLNQAQRFTDFSISVDIMDWDETLRSGFGPTARTSGVAGIGTLDGYIFGIITDGVNEDGQATGPLAVLNRLDDEVTANLALAPFELDPEQQYQLRFSGVGPDLIGHVYDLNDLANPLVTLTANDSTYANGGNGFAAAAEGLDPTRWTLPLQAADVTLDNYSLTATVPEPSTFWFALTAAIGLLRVRRKCPRRS